MMHGAYKIKFARLIECTVDVIELISNDSVYVARNEYIYKYRMSVDVLNSYTSLPLCQFSRIARLK